MEHQRNCAFVDAHRTVCYFASFVGSIAQKLQKAPHRVLPCQLEVLCWIVAILSSSSEYERWPQERIPLFYHQSPHLHIDIEKLLCISVQA